MASTKEQMMKARELIKAKKYNEAHAILKKIDHPTAKEWLAKLDNMPAAQKSGKGKATSSKKSREKARSGSGGRGLLLRVVVLVLIIALAGAAYVVLNNNSDDNGDEDTSETVTNPTEIPAAPDETGDNQAAPPDVNTPTDENDTDDTDSPNLPPALGNNGNNSGPFSSATEPGHNDSELPPFMQPGGDGQPSNNSGMPPFGNVGAPPIGGEVTVIDPIGGTITLELPEGWTQQVTGVGAFSHPDFGDAVVAVSAAPPAITPENLTVEEISTLVAPGGEEVDFTSWNVNGTDILHFTVTAQGGDQTDFFYVPDSTSGKVAIFVIPAHAQRSDDLRDAVLDMAATVQFE